MNSLQCVFDNKTSFLIMYYRPMDQAELESHLNCIRTRTTSAKVLVRMSNLARGSRIEWSCACRPMRTFPNATTNLAGSSSQLSEHAHFGCSSSPLPPTGTDIVSRVVLIRDQLVGVPAIQPEPDITDESGLLRGDFHYDLIGISPLQGFTLIDCA